MSEGIRSGVNWTPVVRQVQRVGEGVDHQGLGQAGDADQEAMASREDGDEQFFEDRLLADNDLAELPFQFIERVFESFHGGEVVVLQRLGRRFVTHAGDLP